MQADNEKISLRQAYFILLTITFTPTVRFIPTYTTQKARQAAWLAPFWATLVLLLLVLIWQAIYKKFGDRSLMDIYNDITGSIAGKFLAGLHLIWVVLLTALYTRYFALRLVSSVYSNININVFIISMLIIIAYTIRSGFTTLARMNEIILPILVVICYTLIFLMMIRIRPEFLTPISYRDVFRSMNASIGVTAVLAYFTLLFILGDKINDKEKIFKSGYKISIFLFVSITLILIPTIGIFSYTFIQRTHTPFLMAVKDISLFDTLEKLESVVVAIWVSSDFVFISFLIMCTMRIISTLFKLSDTKPFINIYIVLIYLLSIYLARNAFEMQQFSSHFVIYGNIVIGFILPAVVFLIGKIRKKV